MQSPGQLRCLIFLTLQQLGPLCSSRHWGTEPQDYLSPLCVLAPNSAWHRADFY